VTKRKKQSAPKDAAAPALATALSPNPKPGDVAVTADGDVVVGYKSPGMAKAAWVGTLDPVVSMLALRIEAEQKQHATELVQQRQQHEAALDELRKQLKGRRVREPTIPWVPILLRVAARIGLHGMPKDREASKQTARRVSAQAELIRWFGDAADAVGAKPSESSIKSLVRALLDCAPEAEKRWSVTHKE
jgi:hypothetical protein